MSAAEIHRELCPAVYSQNLMSEVIVRQLCKVFKDGRNDVHDEERSTRPSLLSDDNKICFSRCFFCSQLTGSYFPSTLVIMIFTCYKYDVLKAGRML
jgi:hypothetical protein